MMNKKIAVIGSGMMGGAIIKSLAKGIDPAAITAVDVFADKLKEFEQLGVKTSADSVKAAKTADIIIVVVKPGDVAKVLKQISKEIKGKLVISAAATVPLSFLAENVPVETRVVRIIPNLCALVQAAYTAYCCTENVTDEDRETVKQLLSLMGTCDEVDEKHMDAITAVSGSGPGYMSIIIEALTYAGLKVGLPRDVALNCAAQTVMGTGKLVTDLHLDPAKIMDMTTTPGGTTIEAIYQIEQSQIRPAMIRAIEEATRKSQIIREKLNLS